MLGKVSFEEAYERPNQLQKTEHEAGLYIAPEDRPRYRRQIYSITGERLEISDKCGIGYTIISLTVPGIQGTTDKAEAEKLATDTNNWAYEQIKNNRDKLGAFACLSMHDPAQAAKELRRCVKELGFHGALLCDFQHAGPDGTTYLYYDQPEYDVFWSELEALDVPLYLHPAAPTDVILEKLYKDRHHLIGPPLSFANGVSLHTLGMITNGVFDRHPKAKLILGHYGEHIPFDFWRINHWFEDVKKPIAKNEGGYVWKKTIFDYFKQNIYLTTSGHFSTETLEFVYNYLGADRILFSVDYPYETIENGTKWFDNVKEIAPVVGGIDNYAKIGRENAKKLFHLGEYHDSEAPVKG